MKSSKAQIFSHVHSIPEIHFSDQKLTSFGGLVIFQALFQRLGLKGRLRACFPGARGGGMYGLHTIMLLLIVHIIIGYRRLHDVMYYADDPLVQRVLGLRRLPSASTLSRALRSARGADAERMRLLSRDLVCERVRQLQPARLTLDFDGAVMSTRGHAEGTAVGMNKKHKGARSYYNLFCTVAQTSQIFDVLHRPGNVHDSNGSEDFILACLETIRKTVPYATLESRQDSAFFSWGTVVMLDDQNVEFTISVPFERFAELKQLIEGRKKWRRLDAAWSYFETNWRPKCWPWKYRFLLLRHKSKRQHKGPLQLDLFEPRDYEYEYKVVVTNKTVSARHVLRFHNGRGAQENLFGEAKTDASIHYIPSRKKVCNQLYMMAGILAHNLGRELQMQAASPMRGTTEKRAPRWVFHKLGTLRHRIIQRAARLTNTGGRLRLILSKNVAVQRQLAHYMNVLLQQPAARTT